MVGGITHHAIHLAVVLTVGISGQQLLALADHLAVFLLDEIDLRDVVERLLLKLRMLFQAVERRQCLRIAPLGVVDVGHVVG